MPRIETIGDDSLQIDGQEFDTSEKDSGRRWINNEVIYQKIIAVTGPSKSAAGAGGDVTVYNAHGITNMEVLIELRGYITDGSFTMPLPSFMGAYNDNINNGTGYEGLAGRRTIDIYVTNTDLAMRVGLDISEFSGHVMLLYTKSA